jgi:hypothetical protein
MRDFRKGAALPQAFTLLHAMVQELAAYFGGSASDLGLDGTANSSSKGGVAQLSSATAASPDLERQAAALNSVRRC